MSNSGVLQARQGPGYAWCSPMRDITYLFPQLCANTMAEFDHLRPVVTDAMNELKVSMDDVTIAARDVAQFISKIHDPDYVVKDNDGNDVTVSTLFLDFDKATAINARAIIGYLFLRQAAYKFACGAREVTHTGENDAPDFTKQIREIERKDRMGLKSKLKAIWDIIRA